MPHFSTRAPVGANNFTHCICYLQNCVKVLKHFFVIFLGFLPNFWSDYFLKMLVEKGRRMQFIKGEAAYAPPSLSLTKPFLRETIFGQKLSNSLSFQGHTLTTSKSIKNFKTENFPHTFNLNDLIRGPRERSKKKNGCDRSFCYYVFRVLYPLLLTQG